MEQEERHNEAILRDYPGDGYIVHWEPALCIHSANCVRSLPRVFDPKARPWIRVEGASADSVSAAVQRCPTGALRFERTDGTPPPPPAGSTVFTTIPDGPLYVSGDIELTDGEGNVLRHATRLALCRCGASGNKPYCDNSHLRMGFRA